MAGRFIRQCFGQKKRISHSRVLSWDDDDGNNKAQVMYR